MPLSPTIGKSVRISALLLLGGAALLPLWLADIPPLVDYLNHIARDYVLAHFGESEIFPRYYRPEWAFLPNLAMDLAIVPLARIMPIDAAGKLFLAAVFLLTVTGVFALSFALHGRIELPAYLVFLFLYHRLLLWGYLNFSFGIALALLAFALWLLMREKPGPLRFLVFTSIAVALLLCHLFAFAAYLLFVGGYQIGRTLKDWRMESARRDAREWLLILLHAAVPLILFLLLSPTAGKSGEIRYGSFAQKLTSAFHVVNNYNRGLDYATFFMLAGFIGLGLWKKWLKLAEPVLFPLFFGGLLQLAMPETLFGSQTADSRLPIVLWMLLAAGLKMNPAVNSRIAKPILLGFFVLMTARFSVIAVEWRRANAVYGEYLAAFDKIKPGAKVLSVVPLPRNPSFHHPPVNFIASRAVIGKSAFDPFMFADYGHQPIGFTEPYLELSRATPGPVVYYTEEALAAGGRRLEDWENPFREEVFRQYDYLLLVNGKIFPDITLNHIQPIYLGSNFVLYRIDR
jgi:hypothetical protein